MMNDSNNAVAVATVDRQRGGSWGSHHSNHSNSSNGTTPKPQTFDNKKKKTELCEHFMKTGSCPYGEKCHYAHGENDRVRYETAEEMREAGLIKDAENYMCRPCLIFVSTGAWYVSFLFWSLCICSCLKSYIFALFLTNFILFTFFNRSHEVLIVLVANPSTTLMSKERIPPGLSIALSTKRIIRKSSLTGYIIIESTLFIKKTRSLNHTSGRIAVPLFVTRDIAETTTPTLMLLKR